jgi:mono/diheme cytochrome c family protein
MSTPSDRAQAANPDHPTFETDVRPILKTYCLGCHGEEEPLKGKLDLRLKRFAERGGTSGPAIVPGNPDESLMLIRMQDGEMPPGEKKVPADQIAVVERWIATGAKTIRQEPEKLDPGIDISPEDRAFWAFQPIRRPEPPRVDAANHNRIRTPIDAFVLEKLRERNLLFAEEADRLTLIRRASFDLTGLPPSPAAIDAYLSDPSPNAYEAMIDRLLASPQYGERWARHWLDIAGYADSEGNGSDDTFRQFAYKYRDYVIRSLNADKPLDRFVIEQLAGDELVPRPWSNLKPDQIELLAATGFLRTAADPTATGGGDQALNSNQVVADTLKIVSSTFLGLTVGCAQCHDHKYDPIPQRDYYRLRAVFEPALDPSHWRRPSERLVSLMTDAQRAKSAEIEARAAELSKAHAAKTARFIAEALEKELKKFPEADRDKLRQASQTPPANRSPEQKMLMARYPRLDISPGILYQYNDAAAKELKEDQAKIDALLATRPPGDYVSVLDERPGVIPETHLFHRGDHRQPLKAVLPGDLTIAAPEGARFEIPAGDPKQPSTGRRLAYAKHLVDGKHPLVGRVLANRIWLHHFGRGIVDSPGDFGLLGNRPSHPELLDWLASELVNQGWSLKAMHRLIMTSTVYRQSSRRRPDQDAIDSENSLYARYPLRRLDAESLRDRILAVSGRLASTFYGPAIGVTEDFVGQVLPDGDSPRRSLYIQSRRTKPVSFLTAFDAPVMSVNCDRRSPSTSAPQSLMLMNSGFILDQSKGFAARLIAETPANFPLPSIETSSASTAVSTWWGTSSQATSPGRATLARTIAYAWTLAYQRPITVEELEAAFGFVVEQTGDGERGTKTDAQVKAEADRRLSALSNLCQQIFSSNEFLYVD